jgi:O-acetyl-ADP-ribose deacetylase (regulator of RNase III)
MIAIIRGDLTVLKIDAVVNAANEALRGGGGLDGAIHDAAGPELLAELLKVPGCPTGKAVLTNGYRLPARYIIHAVGPRWRGGGHGEADLLLAAYESVFAVASDAGVRTIAFPAISTGIFGYPKRAAARIALRALVEHEKAFDRIVACLFDDETRAIYEEELENIRRAGKG